MIAEIIAKNIEARRKERDLTQEEVAEILGVSRATYNGIENGKRPVTVDELEKLADFYGVTFDSFYGRPRSNIKFEQMYLRILKHFPKGVPKTKLAKLLYLIDFSKFYDELEPVSGVNYIRRTYGPVADIFFETTDELYDQGRIEIIPVDDTLLIRKGVGLVEDNLLSERDVERIDKICELWKDKRTAEIVRYTHEQNPWRSCRDGEKIPYTLIIQEDPEHVYTPA